jgi:hypothetical protein
VRQCGPSSPCSPAGERGGSWPPRRRAARDRGADPAAAPQPVTTAQRDPLDSTTRSFRRATVRRATRTTAQRERPAAVAWHTGATGSNRLR